MTTTEPGLRASQAAAEYGITEREIQVLRLVAAGLKNRQVGRQLYLSDNTVKTHLQRLYRKLDVDDRAHAVHKGHLLGILGGQR